MNRFIDLAARLALVATLLVSPQAVAQREAELDSAIAAGLGFIATQQAEDGSLTDENARISSTSLALLAMLSAGQVQDVGRHGLIVRRAADYLLRECPDNGQIGSGDQSPTIAQAMATIALAEAFAVEPDTTRRSSVRGAVERMIGAILKSQYSDGPITRSGGWGLNPQATTSDLRATAWSLLALRAGRGIGVDVPADAFSHAMGFVFRCYRSEERGFAASPEARGGRERNGIGLFLIQRFGLPQPVATGLDAMALAARGDASQRTYEIEWFDLLAALHAPTEFPKAKVQAHEQILVRRAADGGWVPDSVRDEPGRIQCTSLALLTLTTHRRALPLYQR